MSVVRDDRRGVPWSKQRLVCRLGYNALMGSPAWKDWRRRWRDRWVAYHGDDPSCAVCGKPWTLTNGDLHHRSYSHVSAEGWTEIVPVCHLCGIPHKWHCVDRRIMWNGAVGGHVVVGSEV